MDREETGEAEKTLRKWYDIAITQDAGQVDDTLVALLGDDLNTAGAITHLHSLAHSDSAGTLRAGLQFMGLMGELIPEWAAQEAFDLTDYEAFLSDARVTAMETKDFSQVDRLKTMLLAAGGRCK